jgi:hypothetical protein
MYNVAGRTLWSHNMIRLKAYPTAPRRHAAVWTAVALSIATAAAFGCNDRNNAPHPEVPPEPLSAPGSTPGSATATSAAPDASLAPAASSRITTGDATPRTVTADQRAALRTALADVSIARTNLHHIFNPTPPHTTPEQAKRNVEAMMHKIEPAIVGDTAAARSLDKLHAMLGSLLADALRQPQGEPSDAFTAALDVFDDEYQRFMREITAMERAFIEYGRAAEAAANEIAIESAPDAAIMQSQREKQFLDDYRKQRPPGEAHQLIASAKAVGDTLAIHVTDAWHSKDVVFRHTNAHAMYITWTTIVGPARGKFARITIVDPVGHEVGGTRDSGMISVPVPEVWVEK